MQNAVIGDLHIYYTIHNTSLSSKITGNELATLRRGQVYADTTNTIALALDTNLDGIAVYQPKDSGLNQASCNCVGREGIMGTGGGWRTLRRNTMCWSHGRGAQTRPTVSKKSG